MNKRKQSELKSILQNLVEEFMANKAQFAQDPRLFYTSKTGNIVLPGNVRDSGRSTTQIASTFDFRMFVMSIGRFMMEFNSIKDLFIFINKNRLWHTEYENYEEK